MATTFGQLVVGPPGSGKSTYCRAMQQFLGAAGRPTAVINLDPANDSVPYDCAASITDLISLTDVMDEHGLGPNGALIFCLEYLEQNLDWLEAALGKLRGHYLLLDCPGQAELYTHHSAFFTIVQRLQKLDFRLCAVHLADVHHCGDASKFVSVVLLSLTAMVRLELPHVNVLSKVDLVGGGGGGAAAAGARRRGDRSSSDDEDEGEDEGSGTGGGGGGARPAGGGLDFDLDYYTDAQDLHQLTALIRDDGGGGGGGAAGAPPGGPQRRRRFMERWARLNDKLVEIIEDHSLVSFLPLSIKHAESVLQIVRLVDKALGFVPLRPGSAVAAAQAEAAERMLAAASRWSELSAADADDAGDG